ncbi:stage II sporulation protein R [Paenibacillus paeoniae]|uniref:Stage II sporulation protein R n=1 Tax=Paenibacillus paeoniae TaxID=2292705 RepID=A0A371P0M3_9BACL|nr:stage II sporulation protein R [Paenibacillus paeoniae]REK69494.1 stage II sporulation protein R [Paenibacillus paeoniae]
MSRTYSYSSYHSASPFRFPYRKSYGFIIMVLMVLIMSWESQQMDAALAKGGIPEEAIRLRILANSDSPSDQLVKRIVRDEIVKAMNSWATGQQTIEEARATIQSKLPELQQIVANVLESRGFLYDSSAALGMVDFPTKMYGSKVYPAGQYEALLITIGEGQGQNWWCVLFPPLCFVDAVSGEASAASGVSQDGAAMTVSAEANSAADDAASSAANDQADAPKAKFFLWELLQSLIDWFKSLF